MDTGYQQMEEERLKTIEANYLKLQADLRKLVEKWNQYEWSGEQDSLYIDLKNLLDGGE